MPSSPNTPKKLITALHPRIQQHLNSACQQQIDGKPNLDTLLTLINQDYHKIDGNLNINYINQIDPDSVDTKALIEANRQTERAYQLKSEFLANLSHELRTPLHAILSFSRFAIEKLEVWPREKQATNLNKLRNSAKKLLDLVEDLLDLAKLESGTIKLVRSPCDLQEIYTETIDILEPQLQEKQLRVKMVQSGNLQLVGDQLKLLRVFIKLLSNAIEYSPVGSLIQFKLSGCAEGVQCMISDEGVGIPEAEQDSIFDQFVQSSRTSTGAGGTGLGLAICKDILTLHNGSIRTHNNCSGGATFTLYLPHFLCDDTGKYGDTDDLQRATA